MLLTPALSLDDDARQLRIVRRRARRAREANRTEVPGVILFEIDGLAEPVLRRALSDGHARRWRGGSSTSAPHRLVGVRPLPRRGPARRACCSAATTDMPAFRWYEKDTGRTMVSNRSRTRPSSSGGAPTAAELLPWTAPAGNMFSGDAPRCSATMSAIRDRQRSRANEYIAYFGDPYGFTRTITLYLWDALLELRAAAASGSEARSTSTAGGCIR